MTANLLNADQERRLVTHFGMLIADLEALAQSPDLVPRGASHARVRERIAATLAAAHGLRRALDLPPDRAPSLKRRVAAVAEVWAARVDDLRAERLRSYGTVHPELASRLDPRVAEVRRLLERLADAAVELPDDEGDAA